MQNHLVLAVMAAMLCLSTTTLTNAAQGQTGSGPTSTQQAALNPKQIQIQDHPTSLALAAIKTQARDREWK